MRCLVLILTLVSGSAHAAAPATEAAAAVNAFSFDLYQAIRGDGDNLFASPYSVAVALAMTRAGAAGDTSAQMAEVLHQKGEAFTGYAALLDALQPSMVQEGWGDNAKKFAAYELHIANRLFGQEGLAFSDAFLDLLKREFAAPLERVDFTQDGVARDRINAWVAEQTHDRIQDILPPDMPPKDCLLALANAIYFKAKWAEQFKAHDTREGDFHGGLDGKKVMTVPFMAQTKKHGYAEVEGAQILELLHKGGDTSVLFVLPTERDGIDALEAQLDAETYAKWIAALERTHVQVKLPRFSFDCPTDLTEVLPKMGMPIPFDANRADFTGMTTEEPLFIGAALHKAFIGIDENGTEAAAATVVMMLRGRPPEPKEPKVFTADHPFLLVIRHRETGAILFMGRVVDPS